MVALKCPRVTVSFPESGHSPVELDSGANLSEHLTVQNSPMLFGCRTGICGTCVVEVEGDVPPPDAEEQEMLEIYGEGRKNARLACQVELTAPIQIKRFGGG